MPAAPAPPSTSLRTPYPPVAPYATHRLRVSELHELYVEESGNPDGQPVVFVHGGPGGGTDPWQRQFFDPARYRIVLFDQRGCGKSTPHAELTDNTTWHLVADMEAIRRHLGIVRWTVFGGSWGSTLALAYAIAHPDSVMALILRGIFLVRPSEIRWFYQEGSNWVFPDLWESYRDHIPAAERHDMVAAYYRRLTSPDAAVRAEAARVWSIWEGATSKLYVDPGMIERYGGGAFADAFARIECHYFTHNGFFDTDNWLIENIGRVREAGIPGIIIQGRYDMVCPAKSAWDLHRAWPEARLSIIADAGHSASELGIFSALVEAADAMLDLPPQA